jgi:hypothetical protein
MRTIVRVRRTMRQPSGVRASSSSYQPVGLNPLCPSDAIDVGPGRGTVAVVVHVDGDVRDAVHDVDTFVGHGGGEGRPDTVGGAGDDDPGPVRLDE